jgi:uncharacterized protein (UPF0335 family)
MSEHNGDTYGIPNVDAKDLHEILSALVDIKVEQKQVGTRFNEMVDMGKSKGYDPKILRKLVRFAMGDKAKMVEEEILVETYKNALGWV